MNHRDLPLLIASDVNRFWSKVDQSSGRGPNEDCWTWTGRLRNGYGIFDIFMNKYGGNYREVFHAQASRLAYFLVLGNDPRSALMCHTCDYPICIRPAHLFPGTQADNLADAKRKGRMPRGEGIGSSILTVDAVIDICVKYTSGERTVAQLAVQYNTCASNIDRIIMGDSWKHVPRPIGKRRLRP